MCFIVGYLIGFCCRIFPHQCPLPSVSYVQRELNKVISPFLFDQLEVDGVAGSKTCSAWMFYSTGWNAHNDRKQIGY